MSGLDILSPMVLLLGTGFLVIYLCRLVHISPIVGFLIAGIGLGPHGLNFIEENETTHFLAELGVVFLLFDIGLHFSTKSAWNLRRDLFGLAPLQLLLSGVILAGSLAVVFSTQSEIALLIGFALALSSTAVVMQMVADLKQTESPVGQSAKAVLIFQDLAAIFLLIFADSIGSDKGLGSLLSLTMLKTALAFGAAVMLGKYILTPLMKSIIKYDDPEMFTVLGLLIVMMTGLATASAGLSLTLGAFLAGMVLAETPFRVLLQTELRPFRSLLMALFFITIGMVMDPVAIWAEAGTVISMTALLIAAKAAIIGALVYIFRRPAYQVIQLSFLLAQGSEFAFVILSMAGVKPLMGEAFAEQWIAAVALSMLLTPLLTTLAYRWSLIVCGAQDKGICNCPEDETRPQTNRPVFIVGMNEVGKTLARAFRSHNIPYIAIDHNRQRFLEAMAGGYIVTYGQSDDLRFWNALGVREARAACIASPRYEVAQKLTPILKKLYPKLKRYVAVQDSVDGVRFAALGMVPFHSHGTPPGLEMAELILKEMGVSENKIEDWREDEQSSYLDSNKTLSTEEFVVTVAAE